jgi:DNA polymerase III subunit delta'
LLFHGPRGVGKQRLALWLGQALLCTSAADRPCGACQACRFTATLTHPDLHWLFPRPRLKDGDPSLDEVRADYADAIAERVAAHGLYAPSSGSEGIYVATVRAIVRVAAMSPAMAKRKVLVIGDAEHMVPQEGSDQAANAFLKLLEEPPADTTIIITSSEAGALLPTIRSRVSAIRVPRLADETVRAFLEDPIVRARLEEGGVSEPLPDLVEDADGAPGRLLGRESWMEATVQAKRLLDAALSTDRSARYRAAFSQGASRARGSFTDTLDALEGLLHRRSRSAATSGDERSAVGAARAMACVERAKEQAGGNVNPQLLSAALLRDLAGLLR